MLGTAAGRLLLTTLATMVMVVTGTLPSSVWSQTDTQTPSLSPTARALFEQAIAGEETNKRRTPGRSQWRVSFSLVTFAFYGGSCGARDPDRPISLGP